MTDEFPGASSECNEPAPLTKDDLCPMSGKYEGRPIRDIPLGYFNWLVQQDWFASKYPEMAEYVANCNPEDHIPLLTANSPCPVRGKHYNKSMSEVPASYLKWLCEQDWSEDKYPEVVLYYTKYGDELGESGEAAIWAKAQGRTDGTD